MWALGLQAVVPDAAAPRAILDNSDASLETRICSAESTTLNLFTFPYSAAPRFFAGLGSDLKKSREHVLRLLRDGLLEPMNVERYREKDALLCQLELLKFRREAPADRNRVLRLQLPETCCERKKSQTESLYAAAIATFCALHQVNPNSRDTQEIPVRLIVSGSEMKSLADVEAVGESMYSAMDAHCQIRLPPGYFLEFYRQAQIFFRDNMQIQDTDGGEKAPDRDHYDLAATTRHRAQQLPHLDIYSVGLLASVYVDPRYGIAVFNFANIFVPIGQIINI